MDSNQNTHTFHKRRKQLFLLAVITAFSLFGCNKPTPAPESFFIALDDSGSMHEKERKPVVNMLEKIVHPPLRNADIWRFHENCYLEYGKPISTYKDIKPTIEKYVNDGKKGVRNTLPSNLGAELKWFIDKNKDSRIVVVIWTDGEDHDPQKTMDMLRSIEHEPKLKAVLIGPLDKKLYGDLRRKYGAILGNKLIAFSSEDRKTVPNKLQSFGEEKK